MSAPATDLALPESEAAATPGQEQRQVREGRKAEPVGETYAEIGAVLGVAEVPSLYRALAASAEGLDGAWRAARSALLGGTLPVPLKRVLFQAALGACTRSEARRRTLARAIGFEEQALREVASIVDPAALEGLVRLVVRTARAPESVGAPDLRPLRAMGFGEAQLVEAIQVAALAVYFHTLAGALQIGLQDEPDDHDWPD